MIWIVREDGAVARMDFPRFKRRPIKDALIEDMRVLCMTEENLKGLVFLPDGPADALYLRGHGDFAEWRGEHWRAAVFEQAIGEEATSETFPTPEEAVDTARAYKATAEGEARAKRVWAVNDWESPTVTLWDSRKIHGIAKDGWAQAYVEASKGRLRAVHLPKGKTIISEAPGRIIVFGYKKEAVISAFWEDYPDVEIRVIGKRRQGSIRRPP